MKRAALLMLICCLLFSSCGVEADFVISRETASSYVNRDEDEGIFVLINKNSKKYHLDPDCVYAVRMAETNRLEMKVKSEEYLREHGYEPCAKCSSEK